MQWNCFPRNNFISFKGVLFHTVIIPIPCLENSWSCLPNDFFIQRICKIVLVFLKVCSHQLQVKTAIVAILEGWASLYMVYLLSASCTVVQVICVLCGNGFRQVVHNGPIYWQRVWFCLSESSLCCPNNIWTFWNVLSLCIYICVCVYTQNL